MMSTFHASAILDQRHAKITIVEQLKHQNKGLAAMRATLEDESNLRG